MELMAGTVAADVAEQMTRLVSQLGVAENEAVRKQMQLERQ